MQPIDLSSIKNDVDYSEVNYICLHILFLCIITKLFTDSSNSTKTNYNFC